MMVRVALWDRCTSHPSHDAPRSLFARAKPAPGDEAERKLHGSNMKCDLHGTEADNYSKENKFHNLMFNRCSFF